MLNIIYQILVNTPLWVYILFGYLVFIGVKASKTHVVSIKKLFIMPLIFTYMSIHTLFTSFSVESQTVVFWTLALLVGMLLGWLQLKNYQLLVDKERGLIRVPGSWSVLIVILLIFATKYYFSYQMAVDPALKTQTNFEFMVLGFTGLFTGMFVGKFLVYLYRFKTLAHTNLS